MPYSRTARLQWKDVDSFQIDLWIKHNFNLNPSSFFIFILFYFGNQQADSRICVEKQGTIIARQNKGRTRWKASTTRYRDFL